MVGHGTFVVGRGPLVVGRGTIVVGRYTIATERYAIVDECYTIVVDGFTIVARRLHQSGRLPRAAPIRSAQCLSGGRNSRRSRSMVTRAA